MNTIEEYQMETIKFCVEAVLKESEKARNNDNYLMSEVLKHMGYPTDLNVLSCISNVPSMATIVRYRRELQKQHKSFRASEKVQQKRFDRQLLHKDISKKPLYVTPHD